MPVLNEKLPLKIQSPNVKEHWSCSYRRNEFNHKLVKAVFFNAGVPKVSLPCKIVLERSGVRFYDKDNLVSSYKGLKDSLASLILGKKRGQDDDNPGIEWVYSQVKGKPGVRIEISW